MSSPTVVGDATNTDAAAAEKHKGKGKGKGGKTIGPPTLTSCPAANADKSLMAKDWPPEKVYNLEQDWPNGVEGKWKPLKTDEEFKRAFEGLPYNVETRDDFNGLSPAWKKTETLKSLAQKLLPKNDEVSHTPAQESQDVDPENFRGSELFQVVHSTKVGYSGLLYKPKREQERQEKMPLLVFLHGGTGCAGVLDPQEVVRRGFFESPHGCNKQNPRKPNSFIRVLCETALGADSDSHPLAQSFVVAAPVSKQKGNVQSWDPDKVLEFVDYLLQQDHLMIDPQRVYLTGHSMGGYGTLRSAATARERSRSLFAAIATLAPATAGHGTTTVFDVKQYALALADIPIWSFRSCEDVICGPASAEDLIRTLRENGAPEGKAKHHECTARKPHGHSIGEEVYFREDLYKWFLSWHVNEELVQDS